MSDALLTIERLNELFTCDPSRGELTWRARPEMSPQWNGKYAGTRAGTLEASDYISVKVNCARFKAHRIIWAMHYGAWPIGIIDHVNGNKSDNRIQNLRQATPSQNTANIGVRRDNTSGHKGVSWCSKTGRWRARIECDGKRISLGRYADIQTAQHAYEEAARRMFGDFARLS